MSRAPPYPQRLCPPSPWHHPPWTQIGAPRLPRSLMETPSARAAARCVWSLCLGRQNGAHQKIERWAEHRSWMAAAQLVDATTNQTIVSAGGGGVGEAMRTGGTCEGWRLIVGWSPNDMTKIERDGRTISLRSPPFKGGMQQSNESWRRP